MTQVALMWHMHQPFYEDLVTHEHILPWVRLHALKDYYGMVAILREFPDVHVTFNLVPSLLVQLEAFATGRARDRALELSLKPATELLDGDVDFIIENFFHAQRERMIAIYPRYADLLARRGGTPLTAADRRAAARRFGPDDLRDLQVWHKLAWVDPAYLDGDARVSGLVDKGHHFSESDKLLLREVELEILNRVIPEYRDAAARGQIELSTSPFYHPILPLVCDTDVYAQTHTESRMPRQRFAHPEDAVEQLERAVACHERFFGHCPVGLWPSEGSVSDAMIALVAAAGFKWMATDELILARTLGVTFTRDAQGHLEQPGRLYTAYSLDVGRTTLACAFRDHVLSDLIGFTYAGWNPDAAADDFVGRLVEAGRRYHRTSGGAEAFIAIILDGENAWEHFEGGGRPFLRALYGRLTGHPELRTVTMADGCRRPGPQLTTIFPGSWIDADFAIWIGHADDLRAWSQLADARQALDDPRADQGQLAAAREEILVAEGSDWFWWYGDDHSSAHDLEFDDLFRRHLRNAYQLLHLPIPDELFLSNISTGAAASAQTEPIGLLSPTIDGEETSYFEWLGAGTLEAQDTAGAMHRAERTPRVLTLIQFGFDDLRLYVRVDASRPLADLLAEGYELTLQFVRPPSVVVALGPTEQRLTPGGVAAAGAILEIAIPLIDLSAGPGELVAFFVAVRDGSGDVERYPAHRPIEARVPDRQFVARNWTA